jgi:hypothetical protein
VEKVFLQFGHKEISCPGCAGLALSSELYRRVLRTAKVLKAAARQLTYTHSATLSNFNVSRCLLMYVKLSHHHFGCRAQENCVLPVRFSVTTTTSTTETECISFSRFLGPWTGDRSKRSRTPFSKGGEKCCIASSIIATKLLEIYLV